MEQQDLIHEDWREALRHVVKALGGMDAVGIELWPGKSRKAAGAWLSGCLNSERPAKLDLEELVHILRMARAKGLHLALHFLCDDLGYGRPAPVEPADQQADLVRQMQAALDRAETISARLRSYQVTDGVRYIRDLKAGGQ